MAVLQNIGTIFLLCVALLVGTVTSCVGYLGSVTTEGLDLFYFVYLFGILFPVIQILLAFLAGGRGRWRLAVRLTVPLVALAAITFAYTTSGGIAWWWQGFPLLVGLSCPMLIASGYIPDGRWRPWLLQLAGLVASVFLAYGACRVAAWVVLPKDPALLVRDDRINDHNWSEPTLCPSGAEAAAVASGLLTNPSPSQNQTRASDLLPGVPNCELPLLEGSGPKGPVAVWLAYRWGNVQQPWVITGWTSIDGDRSREAALRAVTAVDSNDVRSVSLEGPLRPHWEITTNKSSYTYWMASHTLDRHERCVAPMILILRSFPGFDLSTCERDPEHPGRLIVRGAVKGSPDLYLWVEGDRLLGHVESPPGASQKRMVEAIKEAGYVPLTGWSSGARPRMVGPESPSLEVQAWEVPSFRLVLLHYDWVAERVTLVDQ